MNDIVSILKKYFSDDDINKLKKSFEEKQRANIINNKYFAKVGKNTNNIFFDNLIKEIKLYENNQDNITIPQLVDSFISNEYSLIVLEKINGKSLSKERNDYNTHLSNKKRLSIAKSILNIKSIKLNFDLENNYIRKEKLDKYIEKSKKYLSKNIYLKTISLYNILINEPKKIVIAHGDLIPTNILLSKDEVKFIDWEYISYKPEYYDLTYFLLFSKERHPLEIINDLNVDKKEVYIDALIICLKEICNWIKLFGVVDNKTINKNIRRWKRELNYILKKIINNNLQ